MRSLLRPTDTHIASRRIGSAFARLRAFVDDLIESLSQALLPRAAPMFAPVLVRVAPRQRIARRAGSSRRR